MPLSRRLLLGASAGLASTPVSRAQAPAGGLVVGCWGGAYAAALRALVDQPLAAERGIAVRQVAAGEQARVAGVGALDVALLSGVDAYRLSLQQLFAPVTTAGVGTLPHVLTGLRVPYGVPQARTAMCVVYNASKVAAAPRGFTALFEAARRGQAGFSSEVAVHNLAAAAIAQHVTPASLEAAKSTFLGLKKAGMLRIYPDNESLGRALGSGEIAMAPMWRSRAYVWRQAGRDVRDSVPVEGAIPFTILACVPRQSRLTAPAMLYLDALLHPDIQAAMAQRLGLLPTVDAVRLDRKLLAMIGFSATQIARFRPLSLAAVAQNGVALRRFWDRELA